MKRTTNLYGEQISLAEAVARIVNKQIYDLSDLEINALPAISAVSLLRKDRQKRSFVKTPGAGGRHRAHHTTPFGNYRQKFYIWK